MKHPHVIMEENHMDKLYNSSNPLIRFFHNQRLYSILRFIPQKAKKLRILDAGCGEGHLLEAIHKKNPHALLYGVDITRTALTSARKRLKKKAKISFQDLAKLNFSRDYFDIVICSDVLEHAYDYKKIIANLKRVAKKKASIIVSYPNEINLTIARFLVGIKPAKASDHINSFTPEKMKKEFGMHPVKQLMLPLNLLFAFSLEAVQVFKR